MEVKEEPPRSAPGAARGQSTPHAAEEPRTPASRPDSPGSSGTGQRRLPGLGQEGSGAVGGGGVPSDMEHVHAAEPSCGASHLLCAVRGCDPSLQMSEEAPHGQDGGGLR